MIEIIIFFIIIFILFTFKRVPNNSVYIVDKDTHYYKTYTSGKIYHTSSRYKVTTKISESPLSVIIDNVYETHDGKKVGATIYVTYNSLKIEQTLHDLEQIRRSIDDIIQSSVYFAAEQYDLEQIFSNQNNEVNSTIERYLINELEAVYVNLQSFSVTFTLVAQNLVAFAPHVSSGLTSNNKSHTNEKAISSNIVDKEFGIVENGASNTGIEINNDNNDNPIRFY